MRSILLITLTCMLFTSYSLKNFECPGCCSLLMDGDQQICNCPDICECSTNTTCTCPPDCGCNIYGCIGK